MTYPIHASCQCGQVSYVLKAPPQAVMACHCQACQQLSTAPYSITSMIRAEDIEFSGDMADWSRSSDSGNTNAAKFCPSCGNRVYHYNPEAPEIVKLKLRPIGHEFAAIFQPTKHVFTHEKMAWLALPDNVEQA